MTFGRAREHKWTLVLFAIMLTIKLESNDHDKSPIYDINLVDLVCSWLGVINFTQFFHTSHKMKLKRLTNTKIKMLRNCKNENLKWLFFWVIENLRFVTFFFWSPVIAQMLPKCRCIIYLQALSISCEPNSTILFGVRLYFFNGQDFSETKKRRLKTFLHLVPKTIHVGD